MDFKKYSGAFENSISLFSLKTIDLGLTLWLIPYLIFKIGLSNYGVYAFAMSLVLFFVNVLNYGFNLSTVREVAKNKEDKLKINQIFNEVLSVKVFICCLLYFIYFILLFFIPKFLEYRTLYFYSSLLLISDLFSLRWLFFGLEKMKYIALIKLIGTIIYILLIFQYINNKSDFIIIPLLEAVGMLVVSVVSFIWVVLKFEIRLKILSIREVIIYLRKNFSSFINLLFPSTYGTMIVFLVGVLGVPLQVSFIQIGVKLVAIFSTINTILTDVFYPVVNRDIRLMIPVRYLVNGTGFFLSLLMYFSVDFVVRYWLKFGSDSELENIIKIVEILSPVPFLMSIISSFGVHGLLSHYKDSLFSKITIVSSLSMIFSAYYLVPNYYILGGAISFLLGRSVYAILSFVFLKKIELFNKRVI